MGDSDVGHTKRHNMTVSLEKIQQFLFCNKFLLHIISLIVKFLSEKFGENWNFVQHSLFPFYIIDDELFTKEG